MKPTLVTGSAGHLGEGLMRTLRERGVAARGVDERATPYVDVVGSLCDRDVVRRAVDGCRAVIHAATLHKPHVATHDKRAFVAANVEATVHLLEESVAQDVEAFVFSSTTSAFGHALRPAPGAPATWIDEDVRPIPKNIYGVTKTAAEDLCQLFQQEHGLPCVVLRTSRFFPEEDDQPDLRAAYDPDNLKVNELLHRRLDLEDAVAGHLLAADRAPELGFARFILSATTPFRPEHLPRLATDARAVVRELVPGYESVYARLGWRMYANLDRVYVNARARAQLGWKPVYDFEAAIDRLAENEPFSSELARAVGSKGYH